ncbi:hypothetical protein CC78DRAFT_589040 [Lojkania enalia]|uniref:Uncharacterized protein n=1 Tax=Lojkania enalia TaxID=147567 RepID=A0A9P4NDE9_9PLEO|nr:hypothetical protein CC78DRAFT_589040 [Didymosphaeria enalia]
MHGVPSSLGGTPHLQSPPKEMLMHLEDEEPIRQQNLPLKLRSPIPVFPKPLALQFQNFVDYYSIHGYADGTRMEVGSRLVGDMLPHYFPTPNFTCRRLFTPDKNIIETIPVQGTAYWVVEANESSESKSTSAPDKLEIGASICNETLTTSQDSLALLVVVVTYYPFLERLERKVPAQLHFSAFATGDNNTIVIEKDEIETYTTYRRGNVAILAGTPKPLFPGFEFYTFDIDSDTGSSIMPWFGQCERHPEGFGTNSFPLQKSEAEKIDFLLRVIANSREKGHPLIATSPAILQTDTPSISREVTPNGAIALTDEYIQTLKINKNGRLLASGGQFLRRDLEEEAKQIAIARGIRFSSPSHKRKRDRHRGKQHRQSFKSDMREGY